ncbi:hypothetical protein PybrP1_008809 [[Pythium] brassicae (nom. inval.)]|nr:hypothetical protein PybrP1_008809 [[Pythium] brassicae (nom. inval.)]
MSWHNNWGTVKSTTAKACALYFEVANVGKTIESSKKRVIWRVKVEDGREFEIILTHSLASGKKVLRIDGIVKYTSKSLSFGDWDHVFNLPGGYTVHIIIKPSVELNDMYDLIIDGTSFRRLPDRLDPNRAKNSTPSSSGVVSSTPVRSNGASSARTNSYNYSSGHYDSSGPSSRESSFSPWPCSRCTLVNEKPLAPICEACGAPKPDYISPEDRQRAKEAVQHRPVASVSTRAPTTTTSSARAPSKTPGSDFFSSPSPSDRDGFPSFGGADPFSTAAADSSFGKQSLFAATTTTSKPATTTEEISSMLSGLDFTAAPVQPAPAPPSTGSGDLWTSSMVDLNLKPAEKKKAVSAKSYQTLEQARMQAPKEKVAVLPPPPPMPVVAPGAFYGTNMAAPGGFYQQQQPQPHMYNTVGAGAYGMAGALGGQPSVHNNSAIAVYGGNFGAAPQQQFHQGFPPAKPNVFGSDPFATLS